MTFHHQQLYQTGIREPFQLCLVCLAYYGKYKNWSFFISRIEKSFFACSHSMNIEQLNENLEKIKELHEGLFNYLNRLDPVKLTFTGYKKS
jgi:hypothetical protein